MEEHNFQNQDESKGKTFWSFIDNQISNATIRIQALISILLNNQNFFQLQPRWKTVMERREHEHRVELLWKHFQQSPTIRFPERGTKQISSKFGSPIKEKRLRLWPSGQKLFGSYGKMRVAKSTKNTSKSIAFLWHLRFIKHLTLGTKSVNFLTQRDFTAKKIVD